MALEVERKFRVTELGAIRERLRGIGANFHGVFLEANVLLDTPDHRLRDSGCGLRIRTWFPQGENLGSPPISQLTFKGPQLPGSARIRDELEVTLSDPDILQRMMAMLGFVPRLRYRKQRERWEYDHAHIELDRLPWLGYFVEVEAVNEAAVDQVVKSLGLVGRDEDSQTYVALLFGECARRGVDPLCLADAIDFNVEIV